MVSLKKIFISLGLLLSLVGCLEWFVNLQPYIDTNTNTSIKKNDDILEISNENYYIKFYGKSSGTTSEYNPTIKVFVFMDLIFNNKTKLRLDDIILSDSLSKNFQPLVFINNEQIDKAEFLFNSGEKYQMYLKFGSYEDEVYLPVKLEIDKLLNVDREVHYSIGPIYYSYQ